MAYGAPSKSEIETLNVRGRIKDKQILTGLTEIAAYTGLSINTIRRAIRHHGLIAGGGTKQGSQYISTKENVDRWIAERHLKFVIENKTDRIPGYKRMRTIDEKLRLLFSQKSD